MKKRKPVGTKLLFCIVSIVMACSLAPASALAMTAEGANDIGEPFRAAKNTLMVQKDEPLLVSTWDALAEAIGDTSGTAPQRIGLAVAV